MCGRFTLRTPLTVLAKQFQFELDFADTGPLVLYPIAHAFQPDAAGNDGFHRAAHEPLDFGHGEGDEHCVIGAGPVVGHGTIVLAASVECQRQSGA